VTAMAATCQRSPRSLVATVHSLNVASFYGARRFFGDANFNRPRCNSDALGTPQRNPPTHQIAKYLGVVSKILYWRVDWPQKLIPAVKTMLLKPRSWPDAQHVQDRQQRDDDSRRNDKR
jgi:hypothetical protein